MEQLNYKEIWETLSQVDVSKHTETKGEGNFQLTYLHGHGHGVFSWNTIQNLNILLKNMR